jgi:hypothetical protein
VIVHQYLDHPITTHATQVIDLIFKDDESDQDIVAASGPKDAHIAPGTIGNPEAASALCSCLHEGCNTTFPSIEVLTVHQELEHSVVVCTTPATDPNIPGNTCDSRSRIPSGMVLKHKLNKQTGEMIHIATPPIGKSTHYTDPQEGRSKMLAGSEALTSRQSITYAGTPGIFPRISPDNGDKSSGPSPTELTGLEDEDDDEGDISGLLCSHASCPLRFPDWASFDAHAQQPHDYGSRVANGSEEHTRNDIADSDDLRDARNDSTLERNDIEASSRQLRECHVRRDLLLAKDFAGGIWLGRR